jgi:hypothetical protein
MAKPKNNWAMKAKLSSMTLLMAMFSTIFSTKKDDGSDFISQNGVYFFSVIAAIFASLPVFTAVQYASKDSRLRTVYDKAELAVLTVGAVLVAGAITLSLLKAKEYACVENMPKEVPPSMFIGIVGLELVGVHGLRAADPQSSLLDKIFRIALLVIGCVNEGALFESMIEENSSHPLVMAGAIASGIGAGLCALKLFCTPKATTTGEAVPLLAEPSTNIQV